MLFVFSEQKLANILQSSHQRNVKIRTLIEPSFAYRDYSELLDMTGIALLNAQCRYDKENQPWRSPITTVGIPDLPQGDLLHHKVAILDQRIVITGSHNWSDAANHNNDENILIIDNPTVAAHFQREFERLYRGATLGIPESVKEKVRSQSTRCR
jgi:phosphatidylserine/phosphatidylglycerophosphate/cardiolipin synthase-like enzyme